MENKIRVLPPDVLMEPLLGLVQEGNEVPLVISGNSMSPFLVHGRDTVYLSKLKDKPKKGDIAIMKLNENDVLPVSVIEEGSDQIKVLSPMRAETFTIGKDKFSDLQRVVLIAFA